LIFPKGVLWPAEGFLTLLPVTGVSEDDTVLVAPQGTTRHETKGDVVFSTIFPKSFPNRKLMMCIPVTALRRISSDFSCAI